MIVESWLVRAARERPEQPAVNGLTYAALLARAATVAKTLEPGSRVGIAHGPGEEFAVALHACMLAGALAVPHDLRMPAPERPAVDHLIAEQAVGTAQACSTACSASHDLDAGAVLVMTSGSSGTPKEVELTYGNLLWSALGSAVALGAPATERWLSAMPLTHVGGLSILVRSVIYCTEAVVHSGWDTDAVITELRAPAGPTAVSLVPTTLRRLVEAGLSGPSSLRFALLGGAPAPEDLVEEARARAIPVVTTYGLTEACSQVATAGRPLFCTGVSLADDGEVLVRGPTVAPGSTADDGALHTGDLGQFIDGRLQITGRKSSLIISGAENVSPERVEAVLERYDSVAEAAVLGEPDEHWGESVVAVVVARGGQPLDKRLLDEHCRQYLAAHERPKRYITQTGPLPRSAAGKLMRHRIELP